MSEEDLAKLGEMAVHLSGRDISDICKDAERKWASKYIRKEVETVIPNLDVYIQATKNRLVHMGNTNLRMEGDAPMNLGIGGQKLEEMPMANKF